MGTPPHIIHLPRQIVFDLLFCCFESGYTLQRAHQCFCACTASGDVDAFELLKEDLKDDEENVIATINRLLTVGMLILLSPHSGVCPLAS